MVKQCGDKRRRFLVFNDSENCMEVFDEPHLPQVGDWFNGETVTELRATRIIKGLYEVEVETQMEHVKC